MILSGPIPTIRGFRLTSCLRWIGPNDGDCASSCSNNCGRRSSRDGYRQGRCSRRHEHWPTISAWRAASSWTPTNSSGRTDTWAGGRDQELGSCQWFTRNLHAQRLVQIPPPGLFCRRIAGPRPFPRAAEWLRHYRSALNSVPSQRLGYPGPLGALPLREALTSYIGRVRGVAGTPDRVLITTGLTQAIVLLCRALRSRGVRALAVEDPCFRFHREAIANTGLQVVPIPVDADGLEVARLAEHDVGAVLAAPAHSYPTGAVLSAARRTALIKWAHDHEGVVIEDDYDAEFRYDRLPIGALQGLAPQRVAYAGCGVKP